MSVNYKLPEMSRLSISILLISIFLVACKSNTEDEAIPKVPEFKEAYLGITPPDSVAVPFATGQVTTKGWEYGGTFSKDLKEFYFLRENLQNEMEFVMYEFVDDSWHLKIISKRQGQPNLSPDGQTMHLGKRYMDRTSEGWSEVKTLEAPFDSLPIMRLTASEKGTYFFDEFKPDITGDIRYSRLVDGKREAPQLLPASINQGRSFHPFIAPDESFLIFDGHLKESYGDSDIYISYKQVDGSWGDPINLGPQVNTEAWEAAASVTPDGKYLLFNRMSGPEAQGNVDIFWIATAYLPGWNSN